MGGGCIFQERISLFFRDFFLGGGDISRKGGEAYFQMFQKEIANHPQKILKKNLKKSEKQIKNLTFQLKYKKKLPTTPRKFLKKMNNK